MGIQGLHCVVTGGSGFVGSRLVEMLVERGAASVKSFDLAGAPEFSKLDPKVTFVQGDIVDPKVCNRSLLQANSAGIPALNVRTMATPACHP
jgi:nucleoside-diphosphate-sugar epimerase